MVVSFDPYHLWLGIPPAEQPPTLYRLLGIAPFENDKEVIDSGANRQMLYVSEFAIERPEESQMLLNELSQARLTLLNDQRRASYEQELRKDSPPLTTGTIHIGETHIGETSRSEKAGNAIVAPLPPPDDTVPIELPITLLPPKVPSDEPLVSFAVEAITKTGEKAEVHLVAESEDDALRIARMRGLFPYHVSDVAPARIEVTSDEIAKKAISGQEVPVQEITVALAQALPNLCCCCGCDSATEAYQEEAAEVANFRTCMNCQRWLTAQANIQTSRRRFVALAVLTILAALGSSLAMIPPQKMLLIVVAVLLGATSLVQLHLWQANRMVEKAIQPTGDVTFPPISRVPTESSEDRRIFVRIGNERYRQAVANLATDGLQSHNQSH